MRTRKAFTLIELMVVIGMIVILMGILLPVLNHVRRSAQVMQQKADFQTITAALEHYRQDFGDYPRNILLPTWNPPTTSANPTAPGFLTLCSALLGPGPAVTQDVPYLSTNLEQGDGADGAGFRSQVVVTATSLTGSVGANIASATITTPINLSGNPPYLYSIDLSVGLPNEEVIGIRIATANGGTSSTLTLEAPTANSHFSSDPCAIKMVTGKIWPNYLDTNAFKVAYVEVASGDPSYPYNGQPELLDRWGGVIQYFTRFGPNNNRMNPPSSATPSSTTLSAPASTTVAVGPLYGYSAPYSSTVTTVDNTLGQNAIWDMRDGAPIRQVNSNGSVNFVLWSVYNTATITFDPGLAFVWMLGDSNPISVTSTNNTANVIGQSTSFSDTLHYDGPFILISAGPDGPTRSNGGFCNFVDPKNAPNPLPSNLFQSTFQTSGNIYNFDR